MPRLSKKHLQMLCHVPARDITAPDAIGQSEAFVHGHSVRNPIANVEDKASRATGRVEG